MAKKTKIFKNNNKIKRKTKKSPPNCFLRFHVKAKNRLKSKKIKIDNNKEENKPESKNRKMEIMPLRRSSRISKRNTDRNLKSPFKVPPSQKSLTENVNDFISDKNSYKNDDEDYQNTENESNSKMFQMSEYKRTENEIRKIAENEIGKMDKNKNFTKNKKISFNYRKKTDIKKVENVGAKNFCKNLAIVLAETAARSGGFLESSEERIPKKIFENKKSSEFSEKEEIENVLTKIAMSSFNKNTFIKRDKNLNKSVKTSRKDNKPAPVIVVDSDNEAEEFENGVIKWKFSGGIKIGSAFVFNKKFKPRVFFDKEQMVLSYFNNEEGKIFDQIIPYSAVAACTTFFFKSRTCGCFRFLLRKPLKLSNLAEDRDNNKLEMYFNEFSKMVELDFFDKIKDIPVINSLLGNDYYKHNYNTRSSPNKNFHPNLRAKTSRKIHNLKTFITFPRNGPNSVTVTKRDIAFLNPSRMLNDTIIDFYLRYLLSTLENTPFEHKIHIFNTFFHKFIERNPENCKNWTKKIDIFKKDFIVIPINEGMHWKAIIICYPYNAAIDEVKWGNSKHCPRIISLDSMKGHRTQEKLFYNIRLFLTSEFNTKFNKNLTFDSVNMPGSDMILSKQVNSVDCGVYLLEYIERFCKAPFVDTTTRESLGKYFFTPQYIIEKRNKILDLIFKLKREE